jgi:hypothetical protein
MGLSPAMSRLYGMISHVDFQIGRILSKIAEKKLDEETVIIFMSDNGAIGSSSYPSDLDWKQRNPSQLRGNKGTVYENGIRIPFAIRWINHIKPQQLEQIALVQDVFPSLMEFAGIRMDFLQRSMEGVSFAGLVQGQARNPEERSHFFSVRAPYFLSSSNDKEYYPVPGNGRDRSRMTVDSIQTALRKGRWKLVSDTGKYQLFDIEKDPGERQPVNDMRTLESMKQELSTWWQTRVASSQTFLPPRFQIGRHSAPYARVFLNGAISTQGSVRLFTLDTMGWSQAGDSVSVLVDVKRKGLYQAHVKGSALPAGMRVALQMGETVVEGDPRRLPAIELDFGELELKFSITNAPSGTNANFETLDFELVREDQRYPACDQHRGGFGASFACGSFICKKVNEEWHRNIGEEHWCRTL